MYIIVCARSYSWQAESLPGHMESYLLPMRSSFLIRVKSCPSALGEWSLTHRITTKVLNYLFFFFLLFFGCDLQNVGS